MKKLLLILLCLPLMTLAQLPTVTLSGSTSICAGDNTPLYFTLGGNPNFTVDYTINGVPASSVFNSTGVNTLNVSPTITTTYTLVSITDGNGVVENNVSGVVAITVNPLPTGFISGGDTICADGSTAQIDITANGTPPFNVIYSDGFNNIPLAINGNYWSIPNIMTAGIYTLISITDINGCAGNVSGVAIVVVNPLPMAAFIFMPQPVSINNPTVDFTDLSSGHIAGIYDFGDGTTDSAILGGLISHTYLDTGSYQVLYTVTSINGCTATVGYTIIIDPASTAIFDFSQYANKTLIKITDILGRETPYKKRTPLFYIYDDGTVEKRIVLE